MAGTIDNPAYADAQRSMPKRPTLGVLGLCAVAAWLAVMAAEGITWADYAHGDSAIAAVAFPVAELALVAVVIGLLATPTRAKTLRVVRLMLPALICAACSFACSMLFWSSWAADCELVANQLERGDELSVELTADPASRDYGSVSEGQAHLGRKPVRLRLLWPDSVQPMSAGHVVAVRGSMRLPADDDGGRWNHRQGFVGMIDVSSVHSAGDAAGPRGWVAGFRDSALERISEIGGDAAGLMVGVILGNKTLYAGSELEQDFKTTGLAHLMAVSGTHLAVVTAIVSWGLRRARAGPAARGLLLTLLLGLYVALTCFAASALRAYVMCLAALGASRFARRGHALSALSACVLLFLACTPYLAFSLGFELSVLCMLGILGLAPLMSMWLRACLPKNLRGTADGVAATLAANLVTLPVTIPLFCQLPLISPLSTLLVSPLVTGVLGLGIPAVIAGAFIPAVDSVFLQAAGAIAGLCSRVVHVLANLPAACVPLDASSGWIGAAFLLMGIALWAAWPRPPTNHGPGVVSGLVKARLCVVATALLPIVLVLAFEFGGVAGGANLVVPGIASNSAEVVMLDVGQGDSMLIRDGDAAILVDTGEEGTVLLKALARHGVSRLDAVVLSHKDADHTGALSALAGVVEVGHVYIHADLLEGVACSAVRKAASWASRQGKAEGVRKGDVIRVGGFEMRLLGPERGGASENDDSLMWLLSYVDLDNSIAARGLLTGDGEEKAVAVVLDQAGDIDFLKVGHHGSAGAVNDEEMRVLKPELSLISVGVDNDYGHPTQQTLSVLERGGSRVLRTDEHGDIILTFFEGHLNVSCQK